MAKAKRKKVEDLEADLAGEGWTVEHDPKEKTLTITVDLDAAARPSKSGKMMLLASSGGWKKIGGRLLQLQRRPEGVTR